MENLFTTSLCSIVVRALVHFELQIWVLSAEFAFASQQVVSATRLQNDALGIL